MIIYVCPTDLFTTFFEAQLICNWIDVTPSLMKSHFAFSIISLLLVDRFGLSLRVFNLEFVMEAISIGCRSENAWYRVGVLKY